MSDGHTDNRREALRAALMKHGTRSGTSTSDGFMFRGTFYRQPGAMKRLFSRDLEAFVSLAGTDFTEIQPLRDGQPLRGIELEGSLNSYKATWRKAAEAD